MLELEPGSVEHVGHPEEPPHSTLGMALLALSKGFALVGGAIFVALIAMSLISIVGRKLIAAPIPGDMELMQMGSAMAAAAFFPYCQMNDGHVRVDFFTTWMSAHRRAQLDGIAALLLAAVAVLLAWRTTAGAITSFDSGETSLMLGWPVWLAIAGIVPSLVLLACTGLYIARRRFRAAGRSGLQRGCSQSLAHPGGVGERAA